MKISKQDIKRVLNGDLFRSEAVKKQYPFAIMVVVLIMVYILAGYHMIDQQKQIVRLNREIDDSRFEYLSIYTDLVQVSRPTVVIDQLAEKNSDLEINMRPLIQLEMPRHE
ncbi:MAG: hypothetical protein J5937_06080 [Paludibacteraceae bacterium]|jgi:hypothetical protein|nr:hypothetical protein [Paludibacteraceae bacterium]